MTAARPRPLAAVQRALREQAPVGGQTERCEMCAVPIEPHHSHVVDLDSRQLLCTCRPCALLFTASGAGSGRYRAVGDRILTLTDFALSPAQWDALAIPVGIAFLFANSRLGRTVAFYPSPAGATESELDLRAWDEVVAANPALRAVEPDVEAVLLRADERSGRFEAFVVPIDVCYELVGRMRSLWRGFEGGSQARQAVAAFFDDVRRRSRPAPLESAQAAVQP